MGKWYFFKNPEITYNCEFIFGRQIAFVIRLTVLHLMTSVGQHSFISVVISFVGILMVEMLLGGALCNN
jgi:hypothetical protein